jgi:DNA-binding transcriptional regulator YhcF (GntR family)
MNSRQKNGYRDVVGHLESLIVSGALPPGTKLPSLRQLCAEFDISIGTAGRGLKMLLDKGMIDVRRGAGSYVASRSGKSTSPDRPTAARKIKIGAFLESNELVNSYCSHALRGAQDMAMLNDCSVYLNYLPVFRKAPTEKLLEMAEICDVFLMLGEYDLSLAELPGGRPYVGVEMHGDFGGVCSDISLDPLSAAELSCRFFQERGCKKVKAIVMPHLPIHRYRELIFMDMWKNFGELETVLYRDHMSLDEITQLDLSDRKCGYWISSGTICQRLAAPYRQWTGHHLAADRHMLTVDAKSLMVKTYEPMNTVGIDWYDAGVAAFEECLRRVNDPGSPARRIYLNCKLTTFEESLKKK